ncbi:hypothetical protein DY000_02039429 [Brassica cretica]|uniref:Uncharacterized protein n=1 Tax=Brassica cretica TaxID=69181 RepID=A0ABQ7BKK1_BRACR|nr:hypothetical protein DY000_02039429 [Brassica cretica]
MKNICSELTLHTAFDASTSSRLNAFCIIKMELMYVSIVRPIMDYIEVTFPYIDCIHFYSKNSESQLGQQASEVTQLQMVISLR